MALAFVLSNDSVSVVIPGAKSVQQAEENMSASGLWPLPDADLKKLRDLYEHDFR